MSRHTNALVQVNHAWDDGNHFDEEGSAVKHGLSALWRRVRGFRSWLLRDDLADTYPPPDTSDRAHGPTPDRNVNFNAPPGGGIF